MIELTIPRVSWLSSAKVEFFKGGMHDGALGVSLAFSGRPVVASEAASVLSGLLGAHLPINKMVRFTGSYPARDDNLDVFVQALKRYKFNVMVIASGEELCSWMDKIDWLIIKTSTPFLMVQPNEVWYSPSGSNWSDITMPMNPNKMTLFYFDRTMGVSETEEFFCKSSFHWQLI